MKKSNITIVLMMLFIFASFICMAQEKTQSARKQIFQENQEAVNAIAMYPRETRKNIFIISEYPEILIQLSAMQKNANSEFANLISSYSRDEQDKIWNLTRYPDLISDIAANHPKSENDINYILINYPEEIHPAALEEGMKNYNLIVQIDKVYKNYNLEYDKILSNYPDDVKNAFKVSINLPDVMDILVNHLQFTILIGDAYKRNPDKVLHKTDSLNQVLSNQATQETDDWKQSLADNPEVEQEYFDASQQYAQENGYQQDDYSVPLSPDVINYNTNSYNWWFGYPSWYQYPHWNPYPFWYDWGYYHGRDGKIIFFGMPSNIFMHWFFYNSEHCYRYSELSNHYYNYYRRHLSSRNFNSINRGVSDWRYRNKEIITNDWDKDDGNRIKRFKEFGSMEVNRTQYNKVNPQKPLDQVKFVKKNKNDYPIISAEISKMPVQEKPALSTTQKENQIPINNPPVIVPGYLKITDKNSQPVINSQSQSRNAVIKDNSDKNIVITPLPSNVQQEKQRPENNTIQSNNQSSKQIQPVVRPQVNTMQPDLKPTSQKVNQNFTQPVQNVQQQQPRNPVVTKPQTNTNQIRKAEEYHQSTWQQIPPQPKPVQQSSSPAVQQRSAPAVQPSSSPAPQNNKRK